MSRNQRHQSPQLSSPPARKWARIIAHHWEDIWQMITDRHDKICNHRSFAVDVVK